MLNVSPVKAKSMSRILSTTSGLALASLLGFALVASGPARAAEPEGEMQPDRQGWSFSGPLGGYDQGQLQRGFKIYREVCANCHSLNLIAFRNLGDRGGPAFSEGQVKALAAEYKIKDLNDAGEAIERPGRPSDGFPWAYANPQAAAATVSTKTSETWLFQTLATPKNAQKNQMLLERETDAATTDHSHGLQRETGLERLNIGKIIRWSSIAFAVRNATSTIFPCNFSLAR